MTAKTPTLSVYDAKVADYLALTGTSLPAGLSHFLAALPRGTRVLDLGCGPGRHAAIMAAAGLDVLAVDGSAGMVEAASTQPGVTAQQALFDDIPTLGTFGGIWASFSLLHAPRSDFPRHLADLHAACAPGATLMIGMKTGTGEGPDKLGRHYAYYTQAELNDLLQTAGFTPLDAQLGSDLGLAGDVEPWIVITARA